MADEAKKRGRTIKLGVFVTIGAALFIAGVYLIGEKQQLFSSTIRINGIFKDISGLQVGNNVRFAGVNVGIVENIEMVADTAVRVEMVIDDNIRKFIKRDAQAIIGSDGLMGNKIVIIMPGTTGQREIKDNETIATAAPVGIDEIMLNLKVTSGHAADITRDLSEITANIRAGKGTIGKLFMDTALAANVDQTIKNIKQGAGGFKRTMDAAGKIPLLRSFMKKKDDKSEEDKEKKSSPK